MLAAIEKGPLQKYGCYLRSLLIGIGIPEEKIAWVYDRAVMANALPVDCFIDPNKLVPFLNSQVLPEFLPHYKLRYLGYSTFQRTDCICIACYQRNPQEQHFVLVHPFIYDTCNGTSKIVSETKIPNSYRCYDLVRVG